MDTEELSSLSVPDGAAKGWCDEPGLLSDNTGCGPLMALQEHKVQKRNKLLLHQTSEHLDCFYIITKLIYFLISTFPPFYNLQEHR